MDQLTVLRRKAIKELLQQVLDKPTCAQAVFEKWPSIENENDSTISGAWGILAHFCNDIDVRIKDTDYEEILLRQIEGVIEEL